MVFYFKTSKYNLINESKSRIYRVIFTDFELQYRFLLFKLNLVLVIFCVALGREEQFDSALSTSTGRNAATVLESIKDV